MTIYNINLGIGWASSGVEYAQAYRAKLLRQSGYQAKFVFLDFIQHENIQTLTENIGFENNEVIWLYQYFSDIKIAPTTYTINDIKNNISEEITYTEYNDKRIRLYLNNKNNFITCYLKNKNDIIVDRAEFVVNGILIRKDFYSYVRVFSEYYAPHKNKAKLYMRQFYNEDGSIVYTEYIDEKNSMFRFENMILYNKEEFVSYFIEQLKLTDQDIIILDRATKIGQSVLKSKGPSKLGVVIHAEHYSKNNITDSHILWNNFYEYQFSNAHEIDFFITATDVQNKKLTKQFKKYMDIQPKIYTIPVGSLDKLKEPNRTRKPYSIITASRLATEKHVDWIVRAVIKARKELPELTLDIYGEGNEKIAIKEIISQNQAESYIKLKGHVDLENIYNQYVLFVTASTSEGFGLTLMEAVGSGLGMIGFDVDYGNTTFISNNKNGFLVPISLNDDGLDKIVQRLASHIVDYFKKPLQNPHDESYTIAKQFKKVEIKKKWINLIKEVLYD